MLKLIFGALNIVKNGLTVLTIPFHMLIFYTLHLHKDFFSSSFYSMVKILLINDIGSAALVLIQQTIKFVLGINPFALMPLTIISLTLFHANACLTGFIGINRFLSIQFPLNDGLWTKTTTTKSTIASYAVSLIIVVWSMVTKPPKSKMLPNAVPKNNFTNYNNNLNETSIDSNVDLKSRLQEWNMATVMILRFGIVLTLIAVYAWIFVVAYKHRQRKHEAASAFRNKHNVELKAAVQGLLFSLFLIPPAVNRLGRFLGFEIKSDWKLAPILPLLVTGSYLATGVILLGVSKQLRDRVVVVGRKMFGLKEVQKQSKPTSKPNFGENRIAPMLAGQSKTITHQ